MGYRTCEVDKDGRITIYPSLNGSGKKRPAMLKAFLNKLIELVRGNGKNGTGKPDMHPGYDSKAT